ncbi:hypothetical protein [Microbulbifer sp. VAAF005]|uniref:hypothetical protein n=1 Tax=Microbulbifer sp. VAAF005 TaxID=3034230 RepID=UPI0024ADC908|nr:hypothetical protein [Microbulbifer sp. VAAF005]WHI47257.1 hypothetical protein P0078_02450 [Microbulbifer sp. VAAF005]
MSIKVDEAIWVSIPQDSREDSLKWHDGNGVQLVLHSIGFDEALYSRLTNEMLAREYYRDNFAEQGIGIVQCDLVTVSGQKAVKTIGKKIVQGQPALYIGSLAIPMSDRSFVLSLYSQEAGITGMRDTVLFSKLSSESDKLKPDPDSGKMIGWAQDPYFPKYDGPCLRNLSESEDYDNQFPNHPLTKVRSRIGELVASVEVLVREPKSNKPWWKVW